MPKNEPPKQAEVNIGLIGHVDAGKTSLVQALTGTWTDTHSEELKRGISIRLGYADVNFFKCPKCKESYSTDKKCPNCKSTGKILRRVSFVDAPGHEALMTTMLSGAALMQGAVLVIAANEDCPQAQTVEHLNAIKLSGIKNVVVAQNKIDLVSKEEAVKNYNQIKKFLKENGYEKSTIIPTAANFKSNLDILIKSIEEQIPTPKYDLKADFKMYCARSFDTNKPGTKPKDIAGGVVGGSIIQGKIRPGKEIELSPGINGNKILTKVTSISSSDSRLEEATPGGLIALGTELDPSITQNDQMRGQVIATKGTLPEPTKELELEIEFLERVVTKTTKEIKTNERLVLTIGTMTAVGLVTSGTGKNISVTLNSPVVAEAGQKIAVSKKEEMKWRLVAYGVSK